MKNLFIVIFLLVLINAQGQYFQRRFNLNYAPLQLRNERNNSGIRTIANYSGGNPNAFYFVGIGTSYNNTALGVPPNGSDRLRFTRLDPNAGGIPVLNDLGHQFRNPANGLYFNSSGNSMAEVRNAAGNGGYVGVGAVTNNSITGANTIPGGSDILFTQLSATGNVVNASSIDVNGGGRDIAWCIRKSNILYQNQPTWILCGQSTIGTRTDCVVARVLVNGAIVWCNTYNFDPGGAPFNTAQCIAKQLCEAPNGIIYVVGTLQDNGIANVDGLAFALTPAGGLLWANNYNAATDDEFQAIRIAANGNLVIGGFTNWAAAAPVTHHMLIVQLNPAGGFVYQRILRAVAINGAIFTSKCYDIVQGAGGNFFLAGLLIRNGANVQMLYKTDPNGIGINWYSYNTMLYNVGFGIDNVPAVNYGPYGPLPGVAYFSSIKNIENPNFSDSHIMKINNSGGTCNYCDAAMPPSTINGILYPKAREGYRRDVCTRQPLYWATYYYNTLLMCNYMCNPAMAKSSDDQSGAVSTPVTNSSSLKVSPNPVTNTLHVQVNSSAEGEYEIQLIDIQGRVIQRRTSAANKGSLATDLDMSSFAPGMYLLMVKQGTLVLQERIMKQ